ncbi:hypothetical protein JHK85_053841 [Glycine max]|nr:hypothetical protein JHK85_053841 [Glycine max]
MRQGVGGGVYYFLVHLLHYPPTSSYRIIFHQNHSPPFIHHDQTPTTTKQHCCTTTIAPHSQESRLEQLDEIQVKVINTSNGKNLSKCPSLIFELTGVAFGKIAPAEGPLTQPRNFVVMMGFPVYVSFMLHMIQLYHRMSFENLGVEEVVEVWIKFLAAPRQKIAEQDMKADEGSIVARYNDLSYFAFGRNPCRQHAFFCKVFPLLGGRTKTNCMRQEEEMLYKGSPFLLHFKLVLVRHRGVSISYHAICVVIEHRSMGGSL